MDADVTEQLTKLSTIPAEKKAKEIEFLYKILKNIIESPKEQKYQNLNSKAVNNKFKTCEPCLQLLFIAGFKYKDIGRSSLRLLFDNTKFDKLQLIHKLVTSLNKSSNEPTSDDKQDMDHYEWIADTLQQCDSKDCDKYLFNFKQQKITDARLIHMVNQDINNETWKALIPEFGVRIEFKNKITNYVKNAAMTGDGVQQLISYGFEPETATFALSMCGNNISKAKQLITEQQCLEIASKNLHHQNDKNEIPLKNSRMKPVICQFPNTANECFRWDFTANSQDIKLFKNAQHGDIIRSNPLFIRKCEFYFELTPNGWGKETGTILWCSLQALPNYVSSIQIYFKYKCDKLSFVGERIAKLTTKTKANISGVCQYSISANKAIDFSRFQSCEDFSFECYIEIIAFFDKYGTSTTISKSAEHQSTLPASDALFTFDLFEADFFQVANDGRLAIGLLSEKCIYSVVSTNVSFNEGVHQWKFLFVQNEHRHSNPGVITDVTRLYHIKRTWEALKYHRGCESTGYCYMWHDFDGQLQRYHNGALKMTQGNNLRIQTNDIITMVLDCNNWTLTFGRNGQLIGTLKLEANQSYHPMLYSCACRCQQYKLLSAAEHTKENSSAFNPHFAPVLHENNVQIPPMKVAENSDDDGVTICFNTSSVKHFKNSKFGDVITTQHFEIKRCKLLFEITPNGHSCVGITNVWCALYELPPNIWSAKVHFQYKCIDDKLCFVDEKIQTLTTKTKALLTGGGYSFTTNNCMAFSDFQNLNSFSFICFVEILEVYDKNATIMNHDADDGIDSKPEDVENIQFIENQLRLNQNEIRFKDVLCDGEVETCPHIQRLSEIMRRYDPMNEINDYDYRNYYDSLDIVNLHNHALFYHNEDFAFECIYRSLSENKCDIEDCNAFHSIYRDRNDIDDNIESAARDVTVQILDKMHCFYRHSYDMGYRRNSKQLKLLQNKKRKIPNHVQNRYTKFNYDIYGFGKKFVYVNSPTVLPKFDSLKQEVTQNPLSTINVMQFTNEFKKSMINFRTAHRKKNLLNISLQELLSLAIYCNYDVLQHEFSKTYRKKYIQQHNNFYHLGKSISNAINMFGTNIAESKHKAFYHGINKKLLFPDLIGSRLGINIYTPLSTSTSFAVAVNFSGSDGLIVEFGCPNERVSHSNCKHFDVCWLSDFNESEQLFIQNESGLYINNIIDVAGYDYTTILNVLRLINSIIMPSPKTFHSDIQTPETENFVTKIMSNQLSYKTFEGLHDYATKSIDMFCENKTIVDIDYSDKDSKCFTQLLDRIAMHRGKNKINLIQTAFPNVEQLALRNIELNNMILDNILGIWSNNNITSKLRIIALYPIAPNNAAIMQKFVTEYSKTFKNVGYCMLISDLNKALHFYPLGPMISITSAGVGKINLGKGASVIYKTNSERKVSKKAKMEEKQDTNKFIYAAQHEIIRSMGFEDEDKIKAELIRQKGDVQKAINILL